MPLTFGSDYPCQPCKGTGADKRRADGKCGVCLGTGIKSNPVARPPELPPEGFERGMAESDLAAGAKWTDLERIQVQQAIVRLAATGATFTADDVWAELPDGFPVTKGLASVLNGCVRRGLLASTGTTAISRRRGEHDHGQRLTVWRGTSREMP